MTIEVYENTYNADGQREQKFVNVYYKVDKIEKGFESCFLTTEENEVIHIDLSGHELRITY